jgi:hypothetical protein
MHPVTVRDKVQLVLHWYWHGRRGLLLVPSLRGAGRLAIDVPLGFLALYGLYRWLSTLPEMGRRFILTTLENPFVLPSVLLIMAHQAGLGYLRDRLTRQTDLIWRIALLIPGRVSQLYAQQYGADWAARAVRGIRFVALGSGAIGVLLTGWRQIHS